MITLVLPNYAPDEEVRSKSLEFLRNLKEATDMSQVQFIVVENGSYTPELEAAADIYVHKEEPIGYARAVNIGWSMADGDYIVTLNNDLMMPAGWLEQMLKDYQPGTLAPQDVNAPGIIEDSHWFSLVLMDRETFTKIGYLNEIINYRFHDQEYSIRVKKAGLKVNRTGNVVVDHINSLTYRKMKRNEDPAERQWMLDNYGVATFNEYVQQNCNTNNNI